MNTIAELHYRYPEAEEEAVSSFSFTFETGEVIVIFGPNGSGKTTGLKAIAGVIKPQRLEASLPPERFAYVHQDPFMLHRRVRGNIGYGLSPFGLSREELEDRITDAARRCDVEELLHRRANQLSGGQRQRVAIARALAMERPVLLLDEPTANLDTASRKIVSHIIREEARKGCTVILASHDTEFALALGDRFFTMEGGVLRESRINVLRGSARDLDENLAALEVAEGFILYGGAGGELAAGAPARGVFRPEDVLLSREKVRSSALNEIQLEVVSLIDSSRGTVHVELRYPEGEAPRPEGPGAPARESDVPEPVLRSEVSHRSVQEMEIEPGIHLFASVKASSVTIYPEE